MKVSLLLGAAMSAVLLAGCRSTLNLDSELEFPCTFDGGVQSVDPCPANFRCGRENRCHRIDKPFAYLCEADTDCEAEWRCGPDGRCVNVDDQRLLPADPTALKIQKVFPATRGNVDAIAFSPSSTYATFLDCGSPTADGRAVSWAANGKIGKAFLPFDALTGPTIPGIPLADPVSATCLPDGGVRGDYRADLRAEVIALSPVKAMADLGKTVITVSPTGLLCNYTFRIGEKDLTGWCDGGLSFGPDELRVESAGASAGVPYFVAFDESRVALGSVTGAQLNPPIALPGGVRVEDVSLMEGRAFASSDAGMYMTRVRQTGFFNPSDAGVTEPWLKLFSSTNCPLEFAQLRMATTSSERFVLYRPALAAKSYDWLMGRLGVVASGSTGGASCIENLGSESVVFYEDKLVVDCEPALPGFARQQYKRPTDYFVVSRGNGETGMHLRCDEPDGGTVVLLNAETDTRSDDPNLFVTDVPYLRGASKAGAQSPSDIAVADSAGRIWVPNLPRVIGTGVLTSSPLAVQALEPDRAVSGVTGLAEELLVTAPSATVGRGELQPVQHWAVEKTGRWMTADPVTVLLPLIDGVANQPDWSVHIPPADDVSGPLDAAGVVIVLQRPRSSDFARGGVRIAAVAELSSPRSEGVSATFTRSSSGAPHLLLGSEDSLLAGDVSAFAANPELYRGKNPLDAQRATRLEVRLTPVPRGRMQSIATVSPSGENLLNGYLVSSSRVFSFKAVTPLVWRSEELTVRGGTPSEIFVDRNRARVGFREGLVLALPSRVQLVSELDELQRPVVDYEVVCGQTFALAKRALFALRTDGGVSETGKWVEIGGDKPNLLPNVPGRLYRTVDAAGKPALFLFDSRGQSHQVVLPGECP